MTRHVTLRHEGRETDRERGRQTDRQRDRQTDKQRQTVKERERLPEILPAITAPGQLAPALRRLHPQEDWSDVTSTEGTADGEGEGRGGGLDVAHCGTAVTPVCYCKLCCFLAVCRQVEIVHLHVNSFLTDRKIPGQYGNSPLRFSSLERHFRLFFFLFFFFAFPSYISGVHHFWVRFLRM